MSDTKPTAREFLNSAESQQFRDLCAEAGIEPSRRQVRKYRRGVGLARIMEAAKSKGLTLDEILAARRILGI